MVRPSSTPASTDPLAILREDPLALIGAGIFLLVVLWAVVVTLSIL